MPGITIPADAPTPIYDALVASIGDPRPTTPVEPMTKRQRHKLSQHQNRIMRSVTP